MGAHLASLVGDGGRFPENRERNYRCGEFGIFVFGDFRHLAVVAAALDKVRFEGDHENPDASERPRTRLELAQCFWFLGLLAPIFHRRDRNDHVVFLGEQFALSGCR